jgi:hypothetical protein
MRERALEVVSVAAKVKELQIGESFDYNVYIYILTHVTWPRSSLSESLSSSEASYSPSLNIIFVSGKWWNWVEKRSHAECWWCLSLGLSGQLELDHPFEEPLFCSLISPQMSRERCRRYLEVAERPSKVLNQLWPSGSEVFLSLRP